METGYGDVAPKIKDIAIKHRIPQVENIARARALTKEGDTGEAVPTK